MTNWIEKLTGSGVDIAKDGVTSAPRRTRINLIGATAVSDNAGTNSKDVTVGLGGGTVQSITGVSTQQQVDSIVHALVALGLATDDRGGGGTSTFDSTFDSTFS